MQPGEELFLHYGQRPMREMLREFGFACPHTTEALFELTPSEVVHGDVGSEALSGKGYDIKG